MRKHGWAQFTVNDFKLILAILVWRQGIIHLSLDGQRKHLEAKVKNIDPVHKPHYWRQLLSDLRTSSGKRGSIAHNQFWLGPNHKALLKKFPHK